MSGLTSFALAWWLGLYLLRRETSLVALRWQGAGLLIYALVIALSLLGIYATSLLLFPLLCWLVALWQLRDQLRQKSSPRAAVGLILVATLTFTLGLGLLLIPLSWLPLSWLLIAIGIDLLVMGYAVGVLDAFEQGETLLPDFIRSFVETLAVSTLFAFPTLLLGTLPLSLIVTGLAIGVALFWEQGQQMLDGVVFGRLSPLQQQRTELRTTAAALPRTQPLPEWTDEQFDKLTRRALSQMGNLPKLAANPLTQLPLIEARLRKKGTDRNTLARSAELRTLLTESICKLKPNDADFDTTGAWRHFNALYFPYVRGLRPFSRRALDEKLDPIDAQALEWFQREVPPRTLYNWQTAAAKVISADLRDQLGE